MVGREAIGRGITRRGMIGRAGGGMAAFVAMGAGFVVRPVAAQNEELGDAWAAAWSSGDVEQVAAVFAPDGTYEDVPSETVAAGSDALKEWAQGYFDAFTAVAQSVVSWNTIPGGAVAEWLVEGTHRESGNAVSFRGVSMFELADAKIRRETAYYDNGTFVAQTGGGCGTPVV
jgi:steroid delta-isomerase-like uncharacterized protein